MDNAIPMRSLIIDDKQYEIVDYLARDDITEIKGVVNSIFSILSDGEDATPSHSYPGQYAYISESNTLAVASWADGECITIPLSECGEELTVGFDSSATYPGDGAITCIFSVSDALGSSAPNYYSKSNFVNGHSSMGTRGIDNTHISSGFFTIEIAKLKAALPAINAITINFPNGAYLLKKKGNENDADPTCSYPANYAYVSGNSTLQTAAWSGGGCVSIPLSECGEILTVGFDRTATYPGNAGVACVFSTSDALGSSAPNYYTKANFVDGHSTMAERGIDNSHITNGFYTIEIDKLKAALPAIKAITINFPNGSYLLKKSSRNVGQYVTFLHVARVVPSIIVAKDGSGDYTSISSAVEAAQDGDTIYIKDGEYTETVVITKYVHLVGQSKQGTILQQNIGDYNNCPLCLSQGSVSNMTIKSLKPANTSGLTDYAYAIHLDKNFASLPKYQKCEIFDCDIYSEVNDGIGAGTNYASEYDIHDCFIHVAHNPVKPTSCGFKCHNGQHQTTGKITLRNNIIITEDANGTTIYDILLHNGGVTNTQPIDVIMVGNVLKYYQNGITNIFVPSAYNYGNSVAEMNTLS